MDLRTTVVGILCVFAFKFGVEGGALSYNCYEKSCPEVENIIRFGLAHIFSTDVTSPAALLRLMFHDCQVQVSLQQDFRLLVHQLQCLFLFHV